MIDPIVQEMLDSPIRSGARASSINVHRIPIEQRVTYRNMKGEERKAYREMRKAEKARQIDLEDAIARVVSRP